MATDHVDIEEAAVQRGITRKDTEPVSGSPETVAKGFKWHEESVLNEEKLEEQLEEFNKNNPEIKLDVKRTLDSLKKANEGASKDFQTLYKDQMDKPNYHDDKHTALTSAEGLKIFLGGITELYKNPKFKAMVDSDPGKMQQIIDITVNLMARHELDDWWNRRSEIDIENKAGDPEWDKKQQEVQKNTLALCGKLGISPEDFNRMNVLDTFSSPLESTAAKVGSLDIATRNERLEKPYFTDTNGEPDFSFLGPDKDVQRMFLKLYGEAIRSADFLQILNPNYYKDVRITGDKYPNTGLPSNLGSVALASEFKRFRPNAGKPIGWIDDQNEVIWENVGVSKGYLKFVALPNIKPGIKYLQNFNKREGDNVEFIIAELEKASAN